MTVVYTGLVFSLTPIFTSHAKLSIGMLPPTVAVGQLRTCGVAQTFVISVIGPQVPKHKSHAYFWNCKTFQTHLFHRVVCNTSGHLQRAAFLFYSNLHNWSASKEDLPCSSNEQQKYRRCGMSLEIKMFAFKL